MHNYENFWQWFSLHNEQLTMLNDLEEQQGRQLLDELQSELDKYCEGLTYEMGEPTPSGRTLTFSAEGDVDLFRFVVELTDNAPDLDWWEFVGVYVTLEAMIGEFDCATLIGYLDTCAIPDDPVKSGFRPLDDFPDFVEWFKKQRD